MSSGAESRVESRREPQRDDFGNPLRDGAPSRVERRVHTNQQQQQQQPKKVMDKVKEKAAGAFHEAAMVAKDVITSPDSPYGPPGYVSPDPLKSERYEGAGGESLDYQSYRKFLDREMTEEDQKKLLVASTSSVPLWRTPSADGAPEAEITPVHEFPIDVWHHLTEEDRQKLLLASTSQIPLWRLPTSDQAPESEITPIKPHHRPEGEIERPIFFVRPDSSIIQRGTTESVPLWRNEPIEERITFTTGTSSSAPHPPPGASVAQEKDEAKDLTQMAKERATALAEQARKDLELARTRIDEEARHLKDEAVSAEQRAAQKGADLGRAVVDKASQVAAQGEEMAATGIQMAKNLGKGAVEKVFDLEEKVEEKLHQGKEKTVEKVEQGKEAISDAASAAVDKTKQVGQTIKDKTYDAGRSARDLEQRAAGAASEVGRAVVDKTKQATERTADVVARGAEVVSDAGRAVVDKTKQTGSLAADQARRVEENIVDAARRGEAQLEKKYEQGKRVASDTADRAREVASEAAAKTEEAGARAVQKAEKGVETASSTLDNVKERVSQALKATTGTLLPKTTSAVAGVAAEKIGEVRAGTRYESEKVLAMDQTRPMEERVEHANLALQYQEEEKEHMRRKQDEEARLIDSPMVQGATNLVEKIAVPIVATADAVTDKVGSVAKQAAEEAKHLKDRYEQKKQELHQQVHDRYVHGPRPVADVTDATLGATRVASQYIEDTDMKSEIQDRIESATGMYEESRKEAKHAKRERREENAALRARNEQEAAIHAHEAQREREEAEIHRINKQQHWENLTFTGKIKEGLSRFFFGKQPQYEEQRHQQ